MVATVDVNIYWFNELPLEQRSGGSRVRERSKVKATYMERLFLRDIKEYDIANVYRCCL
jgi:hypothetical protein